MITTVRVQEKGQVTIPRYIRKKLNLKKGDLVTFVSTEHGIVIKTLDLAADDLLASLRKSLSSRGIRLEDVLERSRMVSGPTLARLFHLSAEESKILFQALELKAQAAVESIRSSTESAGTGELSESEIESEIRAARDEASDADRP